MAGAPALTEEDSLEEGYVPDRRALCAKSDILKATAAGPDRRATAAAVEAVHSQYEKVAGFLR